MNRVLRGLRFAALAALAGMAWSSEPPATTILAARASGGVLAPRIVHSRTAQQRYRIIGKLRLGFFSITRNDVGTGRLTWQSDGSNSVLALLVGSDPPRAPRGLNQWGYLREEVRDADQAAVFSVRSLDTGEVVPDAGFGVGDGPMFGASCASFERDLVAGTQTVVNARGVTYRMFNQLLDQVAAAPDWKERRTRRPAGAEAGFLTAMEHAIGAIESGATPLPSFTYVYNNTVYELRVRGSQPLGRVTVGGRSFERLTRSDFAIRNRATGDVTRFGVTHMSEPGTMSLPVQIFYAPTFWLSVELRRDDDADVPADPDADADAMTRIRAICAGGPRATVTPEPTP